MTPNTHSTLKGVLSGALFLSALTFGSQAALSADDTGKFAIKGAGLQNCSSFVEAYTSQSGDIGLYGGWIDGYVTGLNQHREATYDVLPWQNTRIVLAMVKSACDQMPEDPLFIDAFAQVLRLLFPDRLTVESAVSGIRRDGTAMAIYKDVIERIEARLDELGFDPGDVDTAFTQSTVAALRRFQTRNGIDTTGFPDQRTLFTLFRTQP